MRPKELDLPLRHHKLPFLPNLRERMSNEEHTGILAFHFEVRLVLQVRDTEDTQHDDLVEFSTCGERRVREVHNRKFSTGSQMHPACYW